MSEKKIIKLKDSLRDIKKSSRSSILGVSKEKFYKEESSNEGYQPKDKLDISNPPIDKGKKDNE